MTTMGELNFRASELSRRSYQIQERMTRLDEDILQRTDAIKKLRKVNTSRGNVHPRGQGGSAAAREREKLVRKERILCEEKLHGAKLVLHEREKENVAWREKVNSLRKLANRLKEKLGKVSDQRD